MIVEMQFGACNGSTTKLIVITQKIVFLVYDTTRALAVLSLMEFAMHQSLAELMSDWSKRRSCGELMTENFDIISKY
jgi:hypothetical protein